MIAKKLFFIIIFIFFPICKRKEFKLFQLLENFKRNVLMHRPSAKDRPWQGLPLLLSLSVSWDATGKQASSGLTLWGTRSFQERTRTKQVFKNKAKIIINKGQESQFSQNVGGPGALGRGLSGNVGHDDCFDICSHLLLCYAHLSFFTKEKRERRGNEFIRYFHQSRIANLWIF